MVRSYKYTFKVGMLVGAEVLRNLNGKRYLYYVYYDEGNRKEIYCGLASKPESKHKSTEIQVMELTKQKKAITEKILVLNNKIRAHGK